MHVSSVLLSVSAIVCVGVVFSFVNSSVFISVCVLVSGLVTVLLILCCCRFAILFARILFRTQCITGGVLVSLSAGGCVSFVG